MEELLAERGVDVSYETVRRWVLKFGPVVARRLRERRRPRPSWQWHLDEMVVRIARKRMYLWHAVDHEGEILDISAHYDSLIAVPATISKVNQSASAGGLGEGGNEDESQEVSEEDPGGRTRYGNHAGPGG